MKKILGAILIGCSIWAETGTITIMGEEIVVTATRMEEKVKETPISVTVITKEEIEASSAKTVIEVLRTVPGLDIVQTGAFGGIVSCFLRGAKSEHTLVMIDGIEVNDLISPGRGFDFAHLETTGIERIEILRGSQGILYGSDAIAGVINIITKKGRKPTVSFSQEGGKYKSYYQRGEIGYTKAPFDCFFSVSRQDSDGISKAKGGTETDGYHSTTLLGNLRFAPSLKIRIGVSGYLNNADFDIDDGAFDDDQNYISKSKSSAIKGEVEITSRKWLKEKINLSFFKIRRENEDGTDTIEPKDYLSDWYKGRNIKVAWQQNISLSTFALVSGIEYEEERGESYCYSESGWGPFTSEFKEKMENNVGYYFQGKLIAKDVSFYAGARLDEHSRFGRKTTYNLSSLCMAGKTQIRASYGTGFKTPSLYQLHSNYGDINLKPDESTSYELGIEQEVGKKMLLGITCFQNDFKNMIEFDFGKYKYKNIGKAEAGGVELFVQTRPTNNLTAKANYTYTQTKDKNTGLSLLRRPEHKAGFNVWYSPKTASIFISCLYIGKRVDLDATWPPKRITLPSYTLVNLNTTYSLTEHFSLFFRAENIFGTEYEEVKGYNTPHRSFYGGIKFKL